jgi:Pentapeptide repeats (8 copies)
MFTDPDHLALLRQGRRPWNAWRRREPNEIPRLAGARLDHAELRRFDLSGADLRYVRLRHAQLQGADLSNARLNFARLEHADLSDAQVWHANLSQANLTRAVLQRASLRASSLRRSTLQHADFTEANLAHASMPLAKVGQAVFDGANVFGVAAWGLVGTPASQQGLIVYSAADELPLTADDLETAQFLHLLLDNPKIAHVIQSVNSRSVLLLGRFTATRKPVLDLLKTLLRRNDFVPLLFDFEGPTSRDLTETVACLAHLSCFVIADLTAAKSLPQELSVITPYLPSVPIVPIIAEGARPYAMFEHLQRYDWVQPVVTYRHQHHLSSIFRTRILGVGYGAAMRLRGKPATALPPPAPRRTRWPASILIDWKRGPPGYR